MVTWAGKTAAFLVAASAMALRATPAAADDAACAMQEQEGRKVLTTSLVIPQLAQTCYGVTEEQHAVTQKFFGMINGKPGGEPLAFALQALAAGVEDDALYGEQDLRRAFAERARGAATGVANSVPPGEAQTSPLDWQVDNGTVDAVPGLDVIAILDASCRPPPSPLPEPPPPPDDSPGCLNAIAAAKAWLRVVQLVEAALTRYAAPTLDELLQRSTTRLAMWHSYRDEGLPQYPWEWLLNSARLNKADKGPGGRPLDEDEQPIGPMRVPTDQIILLHPGVGLEYREHPDEPTATGDSNLSPIIYLEIVGRNRWSWDESTGTMLGGRGISFVATYADREDDTEVGYGVLFHMRRTKGYTLGITRSGDATNIIFNADVAEFFKDKLGYWKKVEAQATR
jgi:hypothetical protein